MFADLIAQAAAVASDQRARAERRRIADSHQGWLERADQLYAARTVEASRMDWCEMRAPVMRGVTSGPTRDEAGVTVSLGWGATCRLDHDHTKRACLYTTLCFLCGKVAGTDRRFRRWCSTECSTAWWQNHAWNAARSAAVRRDDYTCQRCGASDRPGARGIRSVDPYLVLEVNHIVPLVGRGYEVGCVHHLDGLETLCHPCHVAETTRQGRERRNGTPPVALWPQAGEAAT